jgi:DNA-binding MarR family transcriptional regulator
MPERLVADLLLPSWHTDRVDVFALLDGVDEGRRNDAAARVCGHLLARGLTGGALRAELTAWNARNRPPLACHELESVIRSIERREARKGAESREHLRPALEAAWAERPRWGARAGTDCDVLAAHLRIAWRAGRLTWHASVRDLAIEAWSGQWAARAATDRLCAAGLLERVRAADGTRASVFGLPSPCIPLHPPAPDGHGDWESGWIGTEEEALSGEERAALSALNRMGKASAVGLSLALGCTVHASTRRLRALEALGLAEETRDGWRAAEGDARALEARRTARAAERERLRDQSEDERLAWRARVARGGAVALPDRLRGREEV